MHVVEYRYVVEEDGCGCCQIYTSDLTVMLDGELVFEAEVSVCQDDSDLKQAMRDYCPEIDEYEIGQTRYF